jgi:hypothetical protein
MGVFKITGNTATSELFVTMKKYAYNQDAVGQISSSQ